MAEEISQPIQKCMGLFKTAKNDSERFAALFMFTSLMRSKDCKTKAKKAIFETISFDFLKRLLLSKDVPVDCPPDTYKSLALSILNNFTQEEVIATHPKLLENVKIFLDIVQSGDSDGDNSLMAVSDTYKCLKNIVQYEQGQQALWKAKAVEIMTDIYSQQTFQADEALYVLVTLVIKYGIDAWTTNANQFQNLMTKLSLDFETDHTDRKFDLCAMINSILFNVSTKGKHIILSEAQNNDESWPASIYKGLCDILKSKITKQQRDPAIFLTSTMLNLLEVDWLLPSSLTEDENRRQFFLLLIQLTAVEVRMQMEDKTFKQTLTHGDLITACFVILEKVINHITNDLVELEQKEKQTVYAALKSAFTAVLNVLEKVSISTQIANLTFIEKSFIYAMIRVLVSWLAQDTTAMRPQIYKLLPFILMMANDSFNDAKKEYIELKLNRDPDRDVFTVTDVLRVMLPSLCHLTVEDQSRKIMLEMKQDEVLFECLQLHWSIVHYKKAPVPRADRLKQLNKPDEKLSKALVEQMNDSRTALISICNIFMNVTVLEPKMIEESDLFKKLLEFVFENLPELKSCPENLVLQGNFAVLGLLLMKQQTHRIKKNDFSICRYIQATIRFLWDAWSNEESTDPSNLVVSMSYKEHWNELMELWFLGMQTISSIVNLMPWISEFALESGWVEGILTMLKNVKVGNLPPNVKMAYEDFMCHLFDANEKSVATVLTKHDALRVCKNHRMTQLAKKLFGDK